MKKYINVRVIDTDYPRLKEVARRKRLSIHNAIAWLIDQEEAREARRKKREKKEGQGDEQS